MSHPIKDALTPVEARAYEREVWEREVERLQWLDPDHAAEKLVIARCKLAELEAESSPTASAGRREDGAQCVHGHRRYQPGCVSCVLVRRDECRRTLVELEAES